jgi:predicted esterase
MLKLNDTVAPHLGDKILYAGSGIENASFALIMMHGRGSTAESIISLSQELELKDTIIIAPQADQFTWYPYRFIEKRNMNEPGITSGFVLIDSIIKSLNLNNIETENIYLLGFSQGACLALDYAARKPRKYAGIFGLSGGLIGDILNADDYSGDFHGTPVFLGCSDNDFHIPESRVHETAEILSNLNSKVIKKIYPGMGHRISMEEVGAINKLLIEQTN